MTDRPGRPPRRWRLGLVVLTRRHADGVDQVMDQARPGRVVAVIGHEDGDGK